jgi:hypothetical protein
MKSIIKTASFALLVALLAVACNKSKNYSNKLIKAGEWQITELSVDGTNQDELPSWHIDDCDIYEASCSAEWENEEGGHAEFIWQFRDEGSAFEISRQDGEEEEEGHAHESDHAEEEAIAQCYAFSGIYEVIEHKKKMMQFSSNSIEGYAGSTVVIKIEKE